MKDRIAVIFVFILSVGAFLYCLYGLAIRGSIWFFKERAVAQVVEWVRRDDKTFVIYQYKNQSDNFTYTIEKEVPKKSLDVLQGSKEFDIEYSTLFPSFTLVEGISDRSYIFIIIGCCLTFVAAHRSFLALRKKISVSDFT